jgi:PiT family inorganic phosphate transporter
MDARSRWEVRTALLHAVRDLRQIEAAAKANGTPAERRALAALRGRLKGPIEYVPEWVVMGVALALGIGTTIGWKRIVVTVAEKIGKEHLTYSQGASAELVAMTTIGLADLSGLPVSTTHVLSSGIAGTMWANRSGIQLETVRKIGLAWVLTLPAAMTLAGGLYALGRSALA